MSESTQSDELDAAIVLPKLLKAIETNGEMDDRERDRIQLIAITSIYQLLIPLPKRIHRLEERNIVNWVLNHPKLAAVTSVIFALFVMFVHQITPWVMKNIAFLAGFR